MSLQVSIERFPIAGRFIISRGAKTEAVVVTAVIRAGPAQGRGECVPYSRYGETVEGVVAAIEAVRGTLEKGLTGLQPAALRRELQTLMPAGAARNAVDSALWDLEAKLTGVSAFARAEVGSPKAVTTAYTISLDEATAMAEATARAASRPLLKIKLGAPGGDFERIRAVRAAAPNARLIADANEGWTPENLEAHFQACLDAKFSMIEQPLPAAKDEALRGRARPVPVCADESVHDRASLTRLVGLYDLVNVKLDKTGGLTEALELARAARAAGFGIMVGCMVGTSLGMAPGMVLATDAEFVDLDGPLLLARDREPGLVYEGSLVSPPSPALWG